LLTIEAQIASGSLTLRRASFARYATCTIALGNACADAVRSLN